MKRTLPDCIKKVNKKQKVQSKDNEYPILGLGEYPVPPPLEPCPKAPTMGEVESWIDTTIASFNRRCLSSKSLRFQDDILIGKCLAPKVIDIEVDALDSPKVRKLEDMKKMVEDMAASPDFCPIEDSCHVVDKNGVPLLSYYAQIKEGRNRTHGTLKKQHRIKVSIVVSHIQKLIRLHLARMDGIFAMGHAKILFCQSSHIKIYRSSALSCTVAYL